MKLDTSEVYNLVESLKSQEVSATAAFETIARDKGVSPSSVASAYYRENKIRKPPPEKLSDRLRDIASEVAELEKRDSEVERILSQLKK